MVKTDMANQQPTTQQKPTTAPVAARPAGGRPPKPRPTGTPEERAVANLQYTLDRACAYISDGSVSYARRARSAARVGVPKETVLRGLSAGLEAALADARAAIDRAYAEPNKADTPKSRVTLA